MFAAPDMRKPAGCREIMAIAPWRKPICAYDDSGFVVVDVHGTSAYADDRIVSSGGAYSFARKIRGAHWCDAGNPGGQERGSTQNTHLHDLPIGNKTTNSLYEGFTPTRLIAG
jgi:hypothetical protein